MEQARAVYTNLRWQPGLDDIKAIIQDDREPTATDLECRSLYWKVFLLFQTTDHTEWQRITASSRSAYDSLRTHFSSTGTSQSAPAMSDPLDESMESHWSRLQLDETLRQDIKQDVDRCMPEIDFFRSQESKQKLENILFVFCKLNPDLSYRQGMHELLAPILYVVHHDAFHIGTTSSLEEDAAISTVFDDSYIEHDTFTLFSQVMQNAKGFYEQTTHEASENPLIGRSKRIVDDLLSQVDPELSYHLRHIGIAPQIFLIRWLRLLLGREFTFTDVLAIWDVMFSEDLSLTIVDYICVIMLLRIRWDLLSADHNEALSLLLHYPALSDGLSGYELALDSTHLRSAMTISQGRMLIEKYTQRRPTDFQLPISPPTRNIPNLPLFGSARLTRRNDSREGGTVSREPSDLEAMMRSTMKNLYNRGEQLGIGKAVRSAVEDVHRRAQEIKETRTPSKGSVPRDSGLSDITSRLVKMERRNIQLSALLEQAVADLWLTQKEIADATEQKKTDHMVSQSDLDRLSVAIGQVQFVQIYLQDGTLPLPHSEQLSRTLPSANTSDAGEGVTIDLTHNEKGKTSIPEQAGSGLDNTFNMAASMGYVEDGVSPVVTSRDPKSQQDALTSSSVANTKTKERPALAESSYSWMLGQSHDDDKTADSMRLNRKTAAIRPDFLFGEVGEASKASTGSPRRTKRAQKKSAIGVPDSNDTLPYGSDQ